MACEEADATRECNAPISASSSFLRGCISGRRLISFRIFSARASAVEAASVLFCSCAEIIRATSAPKFAIKNNEVRAVFIQFLNQQSVSFSHGSFGLKFPYRYSPQKDEY